MSSGSIRRQTVETLRTLTRPGGGVLCCGATAHALATALRAEATGTTAVTAGAVNPLPFADGQFATVVAAPDWLEPLQDAGLERAIAEIARVAQDAVIVELSDGERPRTWWEPRLFAAGLRRHPRLFTATDYESLEYEPAATCLIMQKIPAAAAAAHPLEALRAERDLHMDMLRETGRRSDAHVARYEWARGWIKPGDVVVDAACGLGYGTALLWDGSEAARVVGVDVSASAIAYAQDCFTPGRPGVEFRVADAEAWEGWPDHSVDCVVSFETLEHLPNPGRFIAGVQRVLKPGGRFLCSVPNEWVDETGQDPNPFHLHVFDLNRLVDVVSSALLVDEVYAQSAGGHAAGFDPRRQLRNIDWPSPGCADGAGAEWWLLSALKDPLAGAAVPYREQVFPSEGEHVPNAIAFGRDYLNPWAVHTLVIGCFRVRSPRLLRSLAKRWLESSPPESADAGAALCILAYRQLEDPHGSDAAELLSRIAAYCDVDAVNAHARRWQVSLRYVEALVRMRRGELVLAEAGFRRCAGEDASAFAPQLETKTTRAAWFAGRLALERGDADRAAADWMGVYGALERMKAVPLSDWLVSPSRPAAFEVGDGLPEIATAIDNAILITNALRQLKDPAGVWRPGPCPVDQNVQQRVSRAWAAAKESHESAKSAWAQAQTANEGWQESLRQNEVLSKANEKCQRPLDNRMALAFRWRSAVRVGIFGTGAGALRVSDALALVEGARVVWFADNDPDRQGGTLLWLDIIEPADILTRGFDVIVIGSMSVVPIREQLLALGVLADQIVAPDVTAGAAAVLETLGISLALLPDQQHA